VPGSALEEQNAVKEGTLALLRCPICRSSLRRSNQCYFCTAPECQGEYPVVQGIPVLINEGSSVFRTEDFLQQRPTTFRASSRFAQLVESCIPVISQNVGAAQNYQNFAKLIKDQFARPRILVLGGSILGEGMLPLASDPSIEWIETDVSFGPRTALICDAHDIPFENEVFDGIVAQAVLEHVVDPYRCVQEMHRVLKPNGLLYAETPFMQQVHLGRYDFTRFTHLGHRRLFRNFDEVSSGIICGPGMALAWAYHYFLLSFFSGRKSRAIASVFARTTAFWLKYFDRYLVKKPGAYDCASAFYFLGRRRLGALPDADLMKLYVGAF
jgi:SAM-dependent methyltransferase